MTTLEAVAEAISYETRIQKLYTEAATVAALPEARSLFEFLARDEGHHVTFLEKARDSLRMGESPDAATLEPALPADLGQALAKVRVTLAADKDDGLSAALTRALQAEKETSDFYRRMVATLLDDTAVFRKLLTIEDGHTAIVQAELDAVTASGYWFDVRLFDMED